MEGNLLICPSCGSDVGPAGPPGPETQKAERGEEALEVEESEEEKTAPGGASRLRKWAERGAALLLFWTLMTVVGATIFAGAAVGSNLLAGMGLTMPWWHLALLISAAPLWVLVVGMMRGASKPRLCYTTVGIIGLALCLASLSESFIAIQASTEAGQYLASMPARTLIAFFACLVGFIVFVRLLLRRSAAGRNVAIASAAFAVFVLARWGPVLLQNFGAEMQWLSFEAARARQALLTTLALAALLGLSATMAVRSAGYGWAYTLLSVLLAVLAVEAGGYTAHSMHGAEGWSGTADRLAVVALIAVVLAYLPVVVIGLVHAWMERGELTDDLQASERFAWQMAVPGAFFLLAMWLPGAWEEGAAEIWAVCLGIAALLAFAHFGTRGKTWLNRWLIVPVTVGAIAVLSDSVGLLVAFRQVGMGQEMLLSGTGGMFLWLIIVVIALSAALGMWLGLKGDVPGRILPRDASIIYTAGWTLPTAIIALCVLALGSSAEAQQNILSFLNRVGGAVAGGMQAANLELLSQYGAAFFGGLRNLMFQGGTVSVLCLAGGMAVVSGLHISAQSGARCAQVIVIYLWAGVVAVIAAAAALVIVNLGMPLGTAGGSPLAGQQFHWPLLWCALAGGLIWRLTDSARAIYYYGQGVPPEEVRGAGAGEETGSARAFLLLFVALIGAGLALAVIRGGFYTPVGHWVMNSAVQGWEQIKALVLTMSLISVYRASLGLCVGLCVAFALILHEEVRQGRPAAYPWVAAGWTALVVWLALHAFSGLQPVITVEALWQSAGLVAAVGLAWLLVVIAAGGLWISWATHAGYEECGLSAEARGPAPWSARWMGGLGALVIVLLTGSFIYNVLPHHPELADFVGQLESGARGAGEVGWFWVKKARETFGGRFGWVVPSAVGGGLVLLLAVFHTAADRDTGWGRWGAAILWTLILAAAAYGLHRMVDVWSMGEWSRPKLAAGYVGMLLLFAVFNMAVRMWTHASVAWREEAAG